MCDMPSWKGLHLSKVNVLLWALDQLYGEEIFSVRKTFYWKCLWYLFALELVWEFDAVSDKLSWVNDKYSAAESHQNKNWFERSHFFFWIADKIRVFTEILKWLYFLPEMETGTAEIA